ncbi:NAD(P)-dependent alcohol dehydrogenase [Devosia sp. WQ 349]|uniref:NAD(P)-dependent alcohol dehydrogenase n=1 Tax=Devosia sp. WQ 349K1 TaxID=2800329 RepID=UPI001903BA55|nr:NAD(P)-dependent alcohol dehydrogenase [Devosia sp. WQ 349K1]
MKAYVARRYGGPNVLSLEDVAKPEPASDEVLVRIVASSVNSGDVRVRGFDIPKGMRTMARLALGWSGPRQPIMGTEFSGVVEAVGAEVSRFQVGDRVFGFPGGKMGAHAEFIAMPANGRIAKLPASLSFEQGAALCFGGSTALHFLRQAKLRPGESILIIGATGTVGHALAQLAQHRGARVSAVTSTGNIDLLNERKFDRVIDYKTTPLASLNLGFDIIADCADALDFKSAQRLLKPKGRYLSVAGTLKEMLAALVPGPHGTKMIAGPAAERVEDISLLAELAEKGHFTPLIDTIIPFPQLPDAHVRAQSKQKRGTVVVLHQ